MGLPLSDTTMTERPSHHTVYKRRRLQGACDICKYKKIRCDSAKMPDNRCTNCISFNAQCTHSAARKKRAGLPQSSSQSPSPPVINIHPSEPQHQPSNLSAASEHGIHPLVQAVIPSSSTLNFEDRSSLVALSQYIFNLEQDLLSLKQDIGITTTNPRLPPYIDSNKHSPDDETSNSESSLFTSDEADLVAQLKRLTVAASHTRHFGPSSSFALLGTALRVQKEARNKSQPPKENVLQSRRAPFWTIHPWESLSETHATYEFPDRELMHELVGLYFDQVNVYWPLLHRPTFENDMKNELYLTNPHFGALVLGVCSVASRYSDNPKVLLDGFNSRHSAGWKWYHQIRQCWRSSSRTPSLYEIQAICLSILFVQGTSQPEACWVMIGIGIRYAQDVGAHRKKTNKHSVESELWKRCFWILVCSDTIICSFLGRPRATVSDDYDLDLILDCDDEYWETGDPALRFIQPSNKPSKLSYFNTFLRLMKILEYAQRTLYATNKLPRGSARGQSDEEIVSYLDSELNQWFEGIPDHLVWTSCSPGHVFYEQSAILHASYHHVRIIVHRSFIPLPKKPSPLPFPSLAICTNAARSCIHVLTAQSRQKTYLPFHHAQFAIFTSAIILLVNHWTNPKPSQISRDLNENMKNVHDCISVLTKLEERWTPAGRLCDVIREISTYGDSSFATAPTQQNKKTEGMSRHFQVPVPVGSLSQLSQGDFSLAPTDDGEVQMAWNAISPPNWHTWDKPVHNVTNRTFTNDAPVSSTDWWDVVNKRSTDLAHANIIPYMNLSEDSRASYPPNPQIVPQWPAAIYNGNTNMDVSDAVMLWLQQPEEWMDLGRYADKTWQ